MLLPINDSINESPEEFSGIPRNITDISASLIEQETKLYNWHQDVVICQDNGTFCSIKNACRGQLSSTPVDATDQPLEFPNLSFLQLPKRFKGVSEFPKVKKLLEGNGPKLINFRTPHSKSASQSRKATWTLSCAGHLSAPLKKDEDFKDGCTGKMV